MKKAIALMLTLVMWVSMCACDAGRHEPLNSGEDTIGENSNGNNTDNTIYHIDSEYFATLCGTWELLSGWRDLGFTLEFREGRVCVFNGEELKWDVEFKDKQWLDEPKEFVNIYRDDVLAYEAHISIGTDETIMLVISEPDDTGLGIVPAGTYKKLGDDEAPMSRE